MGRELQGRIKGGQGRIHCEILSIKKEKGSENANKLEAFALMMGITKYCSSRKT